MEPALSLVDGPYTIDPAEPLKGIVVCCTAIPPESRTEVAQKVVDLGGTHKYDLTPDVTHLIVGEYDTPKYRHVARERQDIKAMDVAWIDAISELWKNDDQIDFWRLEKDHQLLAFERRGVEPGVPGSTREPLLISLTGFGDQRDEIAKKVQSNGGRYTGDLTRRCTHLIVSKPEGKKFTAAKSWQIRTVTLEWLDQSIARGMILDEDKFDPLLPPEKQGVGAWIKKDPNRHPAPTTKRSRADPVGAEEGARKLRKTASIKLNSQRDNIWGDILGKSREHSFAQETEDEMHISNVTGNHAATTTSVIIAANTSALTAATTTMSTTNVKQEEVEADERTAQAPLAQDPQGIFSNCVFYIHGFSDAKSSVLSQTISSLAGRTAPDLPSLNSDSLLPAKYQFLIVPQTSQPDTHPQEIPEDVHIITEFYIEKCLHNRRFFPPASINDASNNNNNGNTQSQHGQHTPLGRPFPLFPIPGLEHITICTAAFTGIELSQVARAITQIGARLDEQFRRTASVLVCRSLPAMRREKLRLAVSWNVPVVSADWLWECISTGFNVPIDEFIFPELKDRFSNCRGSLGSAPKEPTTIAVEDGKSQLDGGDSFTLPSKSNSSDKPCKQRIDVDGAFDQQDSSVQPTTKSTARPKVSSIQEEPASVPSNPPPSKSSLWSNQDSFAIRAPSKPSSQETKPPTDPDPDPEAEAAAKEAQRRKDHHTLTTTLSSLLPTAQPPTAPTSRQRRILGRATSNVSESGLLNNSLDPTNDDSNSTSGSSSITGVGGGNDAPSRDAAKTASPQPPPATQLGYYDPEAQRSKAKLLSRMRGEV